MKEQKTYYQRNKSLMKENAKAYYQKNKQRILKRMKASQKSQRKNKKENFDEYSVEDMTRSDEFNVYLIGKIIQAF